MATRVKRSLHTDTPFPPEESAGQNPPDGAIINYYLKEPAKTPIILEIIDATGKLIRTFASDDKPLDVSNSRINPPSYWIRPFQPLKNEAGMQRFTWDLLYPNPPSDGYDLPISAIVRDTPWTPQGPAVLPGVYNVKLTVNGKTMTQKLNVRIDPRVKTSAIGLRQQFDLSLQAYDGVKKAAEMMGSIKNFSADVARLRTVALVTEQQKARLDMIEQRVKLLTEGPPRKPGEPMVVAEMPLGRLGGALTQLLDLLQDADVTPSSQAVAAARDLQMALAKAEAEWMEVKGMMDPK
jgi:hypothetical protein